MLQEHYIHKQLGITVAKFKFLSKEEYYCPVDDNGHATDTNIRIPVQIIETSTEWLKMSAVKIAVTTMDKVDKYIGEYVHIYNEETDHLDNVRIEYGFVVNKEKYAYFHDAQAALGYREHHRKRYSFSQICQLHYEFLTYHLPTIHQALRDDLKRKFADFIKNKK